MNVSVVFVRSNSVRFTKLISEANKNSKILSFNSGINCETKMKHSKRLSVIAVSVQVNLVL